MSADLHGYEGRHTENRRVKRLLKQVRLPGSLTCWIMGTDKKRWTKLQCLFSTCKGKKTRL